ncbi:TetR/AcrR family transcriptional regulator [Pseudonocardia halophobica]|uniref:TetR/AcrR family transcriptional regulator n=1 Tax=Pseudonocardia halophobica TaxID=29401 RepID=UPI003D8C6665
MDQGERSFPRHRRSTRVRLLAAAEECFLADGIPHTSMEDVARRARISRPTIYRHFSDRDGLIRAALEWRAQAFGERLHAHVARFPTFQERILEGLVFFVLWGRRDPILRGMLQPEDHEDASGLTLVTELAPELVHKMWHPLLHEAQQAGALSGDLDLRQVSGLFSDLELMLVARQEIIDFSGSSVRDMLRAYLLPVLTA